MTKINNFQGNNYNLNADMQKMFGNSDKISKDSLVNGKNSIFGNLKVHQTN